MKIDKVIHAVDDSELYQGFWEIVSKVCKIRLGVTPVLFHITDEETDFYEDEWGLVKKIKKVDNINTGYQAQNVRVWGCTLFPEEVCLISDIDMMMFNKSYFIDSVKDYNDDSFVVYSSDAYSRWNLPRFPMCYHASKGKNYKKILNAPNSFQEYVSFLWSKSRDRWFDEDYFSACLNKTNDIEKIYLKRGWSSAWHANHRIDRNEWSYDVNNIDDYIDSHLPRPYIKHKDEIDKLAKILIQ